MPVRRTIVLAVGVLAVAGAALGGGVALGSSSSHSQAGQPKFGDGHPAVQTRSSSIKPKSQAYVHFATDGSIIGPSKKVVTVVHEYAGFYCVQLANSLHVNDNTIALTSIDWYYSPDYHLVTQSYSFSSWCGTSLGLPNSVAVITTNASTGAPPQP